MTTLTAPRTLPTGGRVTFPRVLRSEWIKLTSLRSTAWSLALIVVLGLGISLLMASTFGLAEAEMDGASTQQVALTVATIGFSFGQLIAAVLGALSLGGEYSTGMVRSTFAAVPRRLPVLWAKAVVLFLAVTVVGALTGFGSWAATYGILDGQGVSSPLDGPLALALLGGAAYLGLVAVFALGIAAAVRNSAGSISIALGILLVLPTIVALLSMSIDWMVDVTPYLLSSAGSAMSSIPAELPAGAEAPRGADLAPGIAAAVVAGWAALSLAIGAVVLRRRDV